jgi:hypothetical protein
LHDLYAIDSKKKIERGFGAFEWQRAEQSRQVVQPAFVEHLTEFLDKRAIEGPILLPPGGVAYVRTVAITLDLE